MVYVCLLAAVYIFYKTIVRRPSERIQLFFLALGSIIFSFFLAEAFCCMSGLLKTFSEKASGIYDSPYISLTKNYYHVWPGPSHWLIRPEFSYQRMDNSLGFADREWTIDPSDRKTRIIALGNSFTEGEGAPYDSSYPYILEKELNATGDSGYVMDAGTCGSDPFYNYINLRDRLLKFKPNVAIQSLGTNDLTADVTFRGGLERFQADGTVRFRPAPWWEPIFALSYISRIFLRNPGYDYLMGRKPKVKNEKPHIEHITRELFRRYDTLCINHKIDLIVVLHPVKAELENQKYNYDFAPLLGYLSHDLHITVIDLMPAYTDYIRRSHTHAADYYWPRDGHHNSLGYKMMAETTLQAIGPLLADPMQR
jgi:lysophospholipase L1-like esterase